MSGERHITDEDAAAIADAARRYDPEARLREAKASMTGRLQRAARTKREARQAAALTRNLRKPATSCVGHGRRPGVTTVAAETTRSPTALARALPSVARAEP